MSTPCKVETPGTKLTDLIKARERHPNLPLDRYENNGVTLAFVGKIPFCTHLKCLDNKMGECMRIKEKEDSQ